MARPAMRERGTHRPDETTPVRRAQPVPAAQLPELDRMIHERMRLGIVSALATNESLSFNDLKRLLKTRHFGIGHGRSRCIRHLPRDRAAALRHQGRRQQPPARDRAAKDPAHGYNITRWLAPGNAVYS